VSAHNRTGVCHGSGAGSGPVPVVTVDGPSGSGKGSLSVRLSSALGFALLDSGALYRLTALSALRRDVALDDAPGLAALACDLNVGFCIGDGDPPVLATLDGEDVNRELRSERCGDAASRVAAHVPVRDALLARQRAFRQAPGLVADGRDMGTVVFPDARLKLFLTASLRVRAQRRYKQLIAKGISASLHDLCEEIQGRDRRDMNRAVAPLSPAADAVVIDTSNELLAAVFERVMKLVRERIAGMPE
jgi:cytidylate kinase